MLLYLALALLTASTIAMPTPSPGSNLDQFFGSLILSQPLPSVRDRVSERGLVAETIKEMADDGQMAAAAATCNLSPEVSLALKKSAAESLRCAESKELLSGDVGVPEGSGDGGGAGR